MIRTDNNDIILIGLKIIQEETDYFQCVRSAKSLDEILRIAEELNARMIVLGRQDRSPLSRLIFGSVTADIIDAANCPVLVINQGKELNN